MSPPGPTLREALRADARFYHQLRYPGRPATAGTRLRAFLFSSGFLLLAAHRFMAEWRAGRAAGWPRRVVSALLEYVVHVVTKSELRLETVVEPGVYLSDRGHIIAGARSIGAGTIIHDRVTIGWGVRSTGTPDIGRDVWIGPGSVIAGNVRVGDGVTILPGTILTRSVPAGLVVEGNPARIAHAPVDTAALRRTRSPDVVHAVPQRSTA
jgi:serine O-acetyltransferase